ncbi:hypothetical protein SGLAM104S_05482 [Streptomyces glaucescens]
MARGSRAAACWVSLAAALPCASVPTASITASGPRPSVSSRMAATSSFSLSKLFRSYVSTPRARARSSRSGTRSTPNTRPAPRTWATRQAMSPIGPRPSTATLPPTGMSA